MFCGVLLPAPVRELITVAEAVQKDAFSAVADMYYQLALIKPRLAGIGAIGEGYIPHPVGPEVSYVLATAPEIKQLQAGALYSRGNQELIAKVKARPFTWGDHPPPHWMLSSPSDRQLCSVGAIETRGVR